MNLFSCEVGQHDEVVVGRVTQFEARCADAQIEQRPPFGQHAASFPGGDVESTELAAPLWQLAVEMCATADETMGHSSP